VTRVFCDTSVLIRYFVEDDIPRALAAASLIESDAMLTVSTGVILEVVHVLRTEHGFANPALAGLLGAFLSRTNVDVADADKLGLIGALSWTSMVSARRIADAVLGAAAQRAGVDAIVTFDQGMRSQSVPVRLL
jgi:predicted nucleic acid-binding protein